MKVTFNSPDEFLDELAKSKPEGGIVRLTFMTKPSSMSPNIKYRYIVGTFIAGGHIVRLNTLCGDIWGVNAESDEKTGTVAQATIKKLEDKVKELGYELRPGLFEKLD